MNKIITQEEIEKAAKEFAERECEIGQVDRDALYKGYYHGMKGSLGKQEKDAEDTVIQGWVAIDEDGGLFLYRTKPARDEVSGMWMSNECPLTVGIKLFPDLTWDDEPQECEIIIKRKKK